MGDQSSSTVNALRSQRITSNWQECKEGKAGAIKEVRKQYCWMRCNQEIESKCGMIDRNIRIWTEGDAQV